MDDDLQARRTAEGRAIAYWARVAPDRLAISSPFGDRTFAELDDRADQLVHALRRAGLRPATRSRSSPEPAGVRRGVGRVSAQPASG